MTIEILESARNDLADGRRFYERQGGPWLGSYFFDTLFSAIDSLRFYGGIHRRKYGFHWMLTPHFPYSVYYEVVGSTVQIYAEVIAKPPQSYDHGFHRLHGLMWIPLNL